MSDVIIVPGRGIAPDGSLPPDPMSRVEKAVELFKAGAAPVIVMSGAWTYHADIHPVKSEAMAMKNYAVSLGVPADSIIEESESKDTLGNMYFTKKRICEPRNWHSIIVVASEDHLPRIMYLCEKVYGPDYAFSFVQSPRVLDDAAYAREMAHEKQSFGLTKVALASLIPGDDATLWKLMVERHPAYAHLKGDDAWRM